MNILKIKPTAILVFMLMLQAFAYAGDPFDISIEVPVSRGYFEDVFIPPPNNTIKVSYPAVSRPMRIVIKNITSDTQSLNIDTANSGLGQMTFEVTDEKDNKNVITKKVNMVKSQNIVQININPGKSKNFDIWLGDREWDSSHKLVRAGAVKLRARVVYSNGNTKICSEYYTILIQDQS